MRDLAREQLLKELLELKPRFERDGVTHLALFGSRARGDNRADSDIDLMIEVDPDRKLSLLDIIGIGHLVEDHIGLSAQIVLRRSAPPKFLANTSADQIVVF
ncbi:nucleotidyltransferase family protein [Devosia sediminis]|uniref:Nucleotidyltransferase domain-containing protein n=1 Tax=Devosia sediminis TaxID=2798801 RepID=A0A934IP89_9HYPH|nr:nucleotidyltransferase domain-containing protein [Devosia sediminis]MBJ3784344.1 nucleotidyltransferase domain-containing protein [Devosia sediminis]